MAAWRVVDANVGDLFFSAHPSMTNRTLFGMDGLLNIRLAKFLIRPKIKIAAHSYDDRTNIKM